MFYKICEQKNGHYPLCKWQRTWIGNSRKEIHKWQWALEIDKRLTNLHKFTKMSKRERFKSVYLIFPLIFV